MERSSISSNKRSHETMTSRGDDNDDDDDDDDDSLCSQTKRFKTTKNGKEPLWSQDAFLQLLSSKTNKHHGKEEEEEEELGEEETSRGKKALGASIHKDICRVQEMIANMKETTGSKRNELMMSIHQDIHLVKQKLAILQNMMVPSSSGTRKLKGDDAQPEFEALQQVLRMMTSVNMTCEHHPIHQPFEKIGNEKKKEEEAVVSRRTTMTASNSTPLSRSVASQRRASDSFCDNCPKATIQIAMDLAIPQIKAAKDLPVLQKKVGLATPKSKATLELSRAKPRRKATGAPDLFTRRERRLKAMKEALNEASMGENSKAQQYAVIWTELDIIWHRMMAHETFKSFAKRKGKALSDDPMKAIDAHLDEVESWISVL